MCERKIVNRYFPENTGHVKLRIDAFRKNWSHQAVNRCSLEKLVENQCVLEKVGRTNTANSLTLKILTLS